MKKIFTSFICVFSLVLLTACSGGGTNASDKGISVASQAISTTDQYLDGEISADTARDLLDGYQEDMAYWEDMPQDTAEEIRQRTADMAIYYDILSIDTAILSDEYDGDNATYTKVVEKRNNLAEDAGLDKR